MFDVKYCPSFINWLRSTPPSWRWPQGWLMRAVAAYSGIVACKVSKNEKLLVQAVVTGVWTVPAPTAVGAPRVLPVTEHGEMPVIDWVSISFLPKMVLMVASGCSSPAVHTVP